MDLFERAPGVNSGEPLAHRIRPKTLDQFVGQDHIVGPGRLLRRVIQADRLSSLIFYGPPGTGKTTLARVIANTSRSHFITMNAVLSGVKDLRVAIEEAKNHRSLYDRRTLLFVDEVHRWNKAQQDALLPWVENGVVILIGATTENPYFEVNGALVSRSRIFQLKTLTTEDLRAVVARAITDTESGYGRFDVRIDEAATEHLISVANGDARSLLNALELAVETTPERFPPDAGQRIDVTLAIAEESIQRKVVLYDKEGDYHFDAISAFIKSIRGSDPDASLYWMSRMVYAGEDPKYLFRRMLISAAEDVGLAEPRAISIVNSAAAAFDRVGMPEGQFFLSEAALFLATAKKSNSTLGFFDAMTAVEVEQTEEVPSHLKDANRDAEGLGHGEGYVYPHAYRDHWVPQHYLPDSLRGSVFYQPGNQGYEEEIRIEILRRREAQLAATHTAPQEILTSSPADTRRDRWLERLIEQRGTTLESVRAWIFEHASPERHHVILDLNADHALLLWEALRSAPEGHVVGLARNGKSDLDAIAELLPETERPQILRIDNDSKSVTELTNHADFTFDSIIGYNVIANHGGGDLLKAVRPRLGSAGRLAIAELVPRFGQLLADLLPESEWEPRLLIRSAEQAIRNSGEVAAFRWDVDSIAGLVTESGYNLESCERRSYSEERTIGEPDIRSWLHPDCSPYGSALANLIGMDAVGEFRDQIIETAISAPVTWHRSVVLVVARA